ncbi:hypothetical protein [Flavobacterium adhaerens]|uniref:hypothetical protein n=1 Tax=Flavobacterium adhaerens TaxID=3149043 RepID=UPI0032B591DD
MDSKFKFLPIVLISYLTVLPVLVIYLSYTSPKAGMVLPILFLLFVISFWLTAIRTRAYKVKIDNEGIIVNRYFGFGKSKMYDFKEIDNFVNLFESGKLGVSESIFIIKNERRIASISSFYHSNFELLKKILETKLVYGGEIKNNFKEEISEIIK